MSGQFHLLGQSTDFSDKNYSIDKNMSHKDKSLEDADVDSGNFHSNAQ